MESDDVSVLVEKNGDLSYRDKIINEIKSLYQNDKEKCDQILAEEGYYDIIFDWPKSNRKGNPFETIPLCWEGPYSYQNSNTWVLLEEFVIEDDMLFAGYFNYHSGPPDYGYMSLENIPTSVLFYALYLIKKGLAGYDLVLPESLLLIKADLWSISKFRLFNWNRNHGSESSIMNIKATFYSGENVYSVVSDQYEELEKPDYCWYFEGDSDGWMNFPDEFNHPWDAMFIDLSKIPQDVSSISIECYEENDDKCKCQRKVLLSITDNKLGVKYINTERFVAEGCVYSERIELVKKADSWSLIIENE